MQVSAIDPPLLDNDDDDDNGDMVLAEADL